MLGVNWIDAGSMDPLMRDGRTLLLAVPNTLGTEYGGDGVRLDPRTPYFFYVGHWVSEAGAWHTTETWAQDGEIVSLQPHEPSHYAEITPPT